MNATPISHTAFGAPARYLQGPGAIQQLLPLLAEFRAANALLVTDRFVHGLLCGACPELQTLRWHVFVGECTAEEVQQVIHSHRHGGCDALIGAGGGKSIDAAKAAQIAVGGPVFIVPTVSSTDAPTSRVAVLYTAEHRLAEVRAMRANPDVVLVDSAIVAQAPRRFFVSGIGDAISKKYEAAQCMAAGGSNFYKGRPALLTRLIVEACHDVLLADAEAALQALEQRAPTPAFERVLEATILLSGLAFENGGLSVAHSLTRGLSAIEAIHGCLHGEEVAYGLIVQLLLEGPDRAADLVRLRDFYRRVGLPLTLRDLGLPDADLAEAAHRIADISVSTSPHIKHFQRVLTVAEVEAAILATGAL